MSAMSQNSNQNVNDEVQKAIKIRRDIDANSANNKIPTNFLVGMCITNQGNSRCNLSEANRNLTTKITTGESWGYFVENNSRSESYGLGRNGQMSTQYISPLQPLRYKIIDNNNVEVIHVGRNGCDITYQYSKIDKNTVSRLATNITSNCDEVMNSIFESNSKKWSEPQRMYPLANRFPELASSSSPQSRPPQPQANNQPQNQSLPPQTNTPKTQFNTTLLQDLLSNRWADSAAECKTKNYSYTAYDKIYGSYSVGISGIPQRSSSPPLVEFQVVSSNQVNIFIGSGEKASEGLFRTVIHLQITRQSDGNIRQSRRGANFLDNNNQFLTRDVQFKTDAFTKTLYKC